MKIPIRGLIVFGLLALGGLVSVQTAGAEDIRIQGGGATFPGPIYQRWVTEYQKLHPEVKIDYTQDGSGSGIKGITDKTLDFAGSDAPMSKKDMEKVGGEANMIEIPTVAGAVVLAYNIPGLNGALKLDGPSIADIYLGNIKSWKDPRIAALNPGVNFPDLAITPAHRTDGSGTSYIFTNYLATQSTEFQEKVGTGKQVEWPGGQGGPQNSGVAAIVKATNGAVGYIELAYAVQNNITFAEVKNKDGKFTKATPDAVSLAGEGAAKEMDKSLAVPLWNQSGADAYPISGFTYIIIYKNQDYAKNPSKSKALVDFLWWATHDGQKYAADLEYAPLAAGVQKKVAQKLGEVMLSGKPIEP